MINLFLVFIILVELPQTVSLIKKVVAIQLRSQKLSKIANRWKSATYAILQKQSHLFVISRSSRTFCTSTIKVSLFLGVDSLLNFWLWRGNTHLFLLSNSKGLDFVANLHSIILVFRPLFMKQTFLQTYVRISLAREIPTTSPFDCLLNKRDHNKVKTLWF